MANPSDFHFFDKSQELAIRQGNLPHWFQPGVTYFVTFRTADSVPQELIRTWRADRDRWLTNHGIDTAKDDWRIHVKFSRELEEEYQFRFAERFMEYLDRGLGACLLRQQELAAVVANCLRHFDRQRYHLGDFVIMPNHVHVLVCLL